jgi:hypothetical protein
MLWLPGNVLIRLLSAGEATVAGAVPRRWCRLGIFLFSILPALAARPALSDTVDATGAESGPAKSRYWLLNPTPDDQMRPFSPDRPGKSQSPYTVDAGHFQIESDFLTYTHDVTAGQSTRSVTIGAPVFKAGLTTWADLEMGFALYNEIRTTDRGSGNSTVVHGFGDIQIGSKINLLGNDGGEQALALLPLVKLPTAPQNLGNGSVEYTVNMPYSRALPDDWNMTLEPVVSILRNVQNAGYHGDLAGIASVSHPLLFDTLTGSLELFVQTSGDRHNKTFYTFDPALAWLVTPDLQLDAGISIGLNDAAPDYNLYFGFSRRF